MSVFQSGNVEIAYRDTGAGPPILLIHGFASNMAVNWASTSWMRTLGEAGRRVVAMDVRGHGQSKKLYDPTAYHPDVLAADAANLLDHLQIGRADVMGYSMGARLAARLAIARPDLVRSLILGGMATGLIESAGDEEEIARALEANSIGDLDGKPGRAYRKFAEQTGSDLRALAACIRSHREPIEASAIAAIAAPTLVVAGSEDSVSGSPTRLAAMMANARAVEVTGRDHMTTTGDRAYKAAVLEFLASHDEKDDLNRGVGAKN